MVDDGVQISSAAHEVFRRELALENRELEVIAIAAHFFVDAAQPFFIGYVVANKIACAHTTYLIGSSQRKLYIELCAG